MAVWWVSVFMLRVRQQDAVQGAHGPSPHYLVLVADIKQTNFIEPHTI